MNELISGKEAWIAYFDELEVEYLHNETWYSVNDDFSDFSLCDFQKNEIKFRLKPQTITLKGIEVPKPFKPKEGDEYWHLDLDFERGYTSHNFIDNGSWIQFGAWRTEEEIKQVVEALRSVFK